MECRKVERLLSSYLDKVLNTSNTDEVKKHLDTCPRCMDELNTMVRIDNLLKLKVKEKPSKEYWENYWPKLESRLAEHCVGAEQLSADRTMIPQLLENRRLFNLFIPPKFASAFGGILIAVLILVNGLFYMRIQELTSSVATLSKGEEEMQKQFSRFLTQSKNEGDLTYLRKVKDNCIIKFKKVLNKKEVLL